MNELTSNTVESSELVEETFNYWFNDHGHVRSPFPEYIRPQLKKIATKSFFEWTSSLKKEAKDEVNEVIVSEKFEEIIFEKATGLVATEDERITILYPFLPRRRDKIQDENHVNRSGESEVIDRSLEKEGDMSYLWVKLKSIQTEKIWETRFELPA